MAITTTTGKRATERYRQLIEGLGEQRGKPYGWMSEVARALGIDASHVKRILEGKRGVGLETIEQAVQRVPIRRAYFNAEGDVDWRDFIAVAESGDASVESPWPTARMRAERFVASLREGKPDVQAARAITEPILNNPVVRSALMLGAAKTDREVITRANELTALLLSDEKPQVAPPLETVRVRAVPGCFVRTGGALMPIGYRKATRRDDQAKVMKHVLPNDVVMLVADGEAEVPLTPHIKYCLEKGHLDRCG